MKNILIILATFFTLTFTACTENNSIADFEDNIDDNFELVIETIESIDTTPCIGWNEPDSTDICRLKLVGHCDGTGEYHHPTLGLTGCLGYTYVYDHIHTLYKHNKTGKVLREECKYELRSYTQCKCECHLNKQQDNHSDTITVEDSNSSDTVLVIDIYKNKDI